MLDDKQIDSLTQQVMDIYDPVFNHYIELMGEHIKDMGELSKTDMHRLEQLQVMRGNAREIAEELAIASDKAVDEVEKIFTMIAKDNYSFAELYYTAQGLKQVQFSENKALQRLVKAESKVTGDLLKNLSNTYASQIKNNPPGYRDMVDQAIRNVNLGVDGFDSQMRKTVKQALTSDFKKISFDSGYVRRVDSQVRMNILEGIRRTSSAVNMAMGEEFGANGVEISAHALCAPDHIPIQGQRYNLREFENVNGGLARPISTLNCKHVTFPILIGVGEPTYSKKQLEEFKNDSGKIVKVDNIEMTKYGWTQYQRKLETNVRANKDLANYYKKTEQDSERREVQAVINRLQAKYKHISEEVGLVEKTERMTVSGYRKVKER